MKWKYGKISLGRSLRSKSKSGFFIDKKQAVSRAEKLIEEYDIRCEGPYASTRLLSGGNIQKLILARSLVQQSPLYYCK